MATTNGLALCAAERQELATLEQEIRSGLKQYVIVGNALIRIRDARLYRQDFDSFEAYCAETWQLSRTRAYQIIDAAAVARELPAPPECEDGEQAPKVFGAQPPAESALRELAKAPPGTRAEVLAEASQNGKKPTAKAVQAVVAKRKQPRAEPDADAPPFAAFNASIAEVCTGCRSLARKLADLLDCDAKTKKPAAPYAHFYTYQGTVGQLLALARQLEDYAPAEATDKPPGFIPRHSVESRKSYAAGR